MITAKEVKALSEKKGIGLNEAKRRLTKSALKQEITKATTITQLKPILRKIIDIIG